jgi:hypothetical protein
MNRFLQGYRRWAYDAKPGEKVVGATAIEYTLVAAGIIVAIIAVVNWPHPKKAGTLTPPAIVQPHHVA